MANNRMCALQSLARSASVCGAAFCSNSSSEICVLIAESNCVHASLKRCLCSLFPICCHSCEWLLLPSSAENGEIRALTSNLFSNSISPPTARNIHQGKLSSPTLGIRLMFFSGKQAKKISLQRLRRCHVLQLFRFYISKKAQISRYWCDNLLFLSYRWAQNP